MSEIVSRDIGTTAIRPTGKPVVNLHCAIFLPGQRIIGDETFRLVSLEGQESISQPFEFNLELHGNTDPRFGVPLQFTDVVGRPVTIAINQPNATATTLRERRGRDYYERRFREALGAQQAAARTGPGGEFAIFNGIATAFAMEIPGVYKLTVKPALWKLTLRNRYCIHRQKNIRDAIADILKEYDIAYSVNAISGDDNLAVTRTQDWLQAGETDFEFIQRLMPKAHLYYYFNHWGTGHEIVFSNQAAYPRVFQDGRALRYTYSSADELGLEQSDVISQYNYQQSLTSSGVRGVFARQNAAWEYDAVATFQTFQAPSSPNLGELPFSLYKIYQYGGSDREVAGYTAQTARSLATSGIQFSGASRCAELRSGHQFTVTEAVMARTLPMPVRPSLENQWFVATQVKHSANLDGMYQNQFQATRADGLVTPFSIQDTQQGVVMAKVVAHGSGVAPGDWKYYKPGNYEYGQSTVSDSEGQPARLDQKGVYVQFSTDEQAAPVWVKLAPHMTFVPEIGVTVMVSRANDASELPEVQSMVQNNGTRTVTPSGWTANTHVGNNYSTSYSDSKSVRFGAKSSADLQAAVGIITAQYDTGQFRDASYSKGGGYSYSTSETGASGLLSKSDSYGSTYSTHHGAMSQSETVFGDTKSNSTVTGTSTSVSSNNIVNSNSTTNVVTSNSATGMSTGAEAVGVTARVSATGVSRSLAAVGTTSQLALTGSSSSIGLTGTNSGVNVTGSSSTVSLTGMQSNVAAVGMNSSTSATGMSESTDLVGMSTRTSLTGTTSDTSLVGMSTRTGLTGMSSDTSITGKSTRMSVTGLSSGMNVTGSSSEMNVTGSSSRLSLTGSSTSIDIVGGGVSVNVSPGVTQFVMTSQAIEIKAFYLIL